MKKFLLLLTLFLSLAGIAKAETKEQVMADLGYSNSATVSSFNIGDITFAFTNAKYYTSGKALRMYGNSNITITAPNGYIITEVKFDATNSSGNPIPANTKVSTGTLSLSNNITTWSGSVDGATGIKLTSLAAQYRATKISVTYTTPTRELGDINVSYSGVDVTENSTVSVPNGTVFNIAAENATSITINGTETSGATATYTATTSETVNVSATDGTATKEFSFTTDVYTAPDAPIFTVDGVSTGVENGYFYGAKLSMTGAGSIYYTTDGSTPSATEGTPYSEAIALPEGATTYKAIVNDGNHDSAVTSTAYTVKKLTAAWSVTDGAEVYPGTEITATANADAAKIFINGAEATSYTIPETAAIGSEITLSAYATVEADNATVTSETATITVKVVEQPMEVTLKSGSFSGETSGSYKLYTKDDDFAHYEMFTNAQNSKYYWYVSNYAKSGLIINCQKGYYVSKVEVAAPSAVINVYTSDNAYTSTEGIASSTNANALSTNNLSCTFDGQPQNVGFRPNANSRMNFTSLTIYFKKIGSDKPVIGLEWSEKNFSTSSANTIGEGAPTLTITLPEGVTSAEGLVKYSSDNISVATIEGGELQILAPGTTTITAYVDDPAYEPTEASYTLSVIDANAKTATDRLNLEAFGFTQNTYAALTYTSPKTGILYSACGMKNTNASYSGGISINSSMAGSKSAYPGIAVTTNDTGWKVKSITIKWFGSINPSVQLHMISSSDHGYAMNEANANGEQFGFREVWTNEQPATNGTPVPVPESLSTPVTLTYDPYSADAISFFGIFASNLHSIEYIDIEWVREATPEVKILSEDATSITVGVEHADYILHYKKIHNDDWSNHWGSEAANAPARVAQDTTGEPLADSEDWVSTGTNTITIDKTIADHQNRHYKFTAFHKDDTALANELNHVNFLIDADGTLTGIEGIGAEAGADAPAEYYDLQGRRVATPVCGLYIRRTGSKVEKVFVK